LQSVIIHELPDHEIRNVSSGDVAAVHAGVIHGGTHYSGRELVVSVPARRQCDGTGMLFAKSHQKSSYHS
jgi:hypothetical protein